MNFRGLVDSVLGRCVETFGEDVTFFPKCGGIYPVRAIFDNGYKTVDPNTEQLMSANQPGLGVNLNDIRFALKQGDEVEVRGTRFRVQDKQEDGQGGATLLLHKVKADDRFNDTRNR